MLMMLPTLQKPDHIVLVIEENKSFGEIIGNKDAAYINHLAQQGALMTGSYAVAHPSLPNYLALFSGSTQDVKDDGCEYSFTGPNLDQILRDEGLSFKTFAESMPASGFSECKSDAYRKKHNPAAYFSGLPKEDNVPFKEFPQDFTKLPSIAYVIPNLNNDMHDGTIAQGDVWLQKNLDAYVQWAKTHNSLLIVTWDEDDDSNLNHIATIIIGEHVQPGSYNQQINHYNLLRTLTLLNGIIPPQKAREADPINGIWSN
jgi:acid phosphatase